MNESHFTDNLGYHVIATARRAEVLDELTKIGMSAVSLDVTSSASIEKCKAQVSEITGGTLDILVNNAYAPRTLLQR